MRQRNKSTSNAARDTAIRRALLAWFRRNARPLPWRKNKNPYAVWVSEIMLQQTQVSTVVPYYLRFLRAFPTVAQLARAPLERVLELWSGLGYYRRARDLHLASKALVRDYGGRVPRDYDELRSLAGIGDYTARALLSIAYDLPFAVLDGNVARVVARLEALRGSLRQPRFRHAVEERLQNLLSRRRPGSFNQALMELGQTVCLPGAPRCPACPLRNWCRGYHGGNPEIFPEPRPRRPVEAHYLAAAVIRRGGKVLMLQGLDGGLLRDLWNFPSAFGRSRAAALARLRETLSRAIPVSFDDSKPFAEVRHGITYRSIRVQVYRAEASANFPELAFRWFPLARLPQAAVSQLARKIAARL